MKNDILKNENNVAEKTMNILLVEDNPGDVLLFKANLLEADFRSFDLSCAETFAAAIDMLKDRKFDLIFLDLSLPDAYGVETLIRLRSFVQNIPVIVITGLNDEHVWTRAIAAGAQDYLVKGQFDGRTLVRSLRYSTERHRLLYELAMANIKLQSEIAGHIKTQESLQSEKDRLTITLRSIADGVISVNRDMRVSLINSAAEEMTGVSSDDAVGKHIDDVLKIINTKTKKERVNPVRDSILEGEIVGLGNDVMLKPENSPEIYISAASSPIKDRGGNVIGAILVFSNISEQKKAEEELIKVSKLESLSLLASGIAHDFNNFLTGIIGNISMAKMLSDQNERIFKILTDAEAVSFQAKELTSQLLTFARGNAPNKKIVDMAELIKNSTNFMARGSNVRCEFNISPALWHAEADAGQINQVVSNLVINAVQAMPDGGSIFVTGENINLTNPAMSLAAGSYVKISIRDTGHGISQENIDKIFDPYFTTKPKGNGLGLASAYSIIKNHNGLISVESQLESGTTFYLYLPAVEKQVAAVAPAEPSSKVKLKGKILIMDDEENIRDITSQLLTHIGFETHTARDGEEAIELYINAKKLGNPFDALIMDLTVPGGMGGVEAIKKIIEIDPSARAIAASGYFSDQELIADYRQAGFRDYITKPFKISDLTAALQKIIAGE